ncbi:MAG: XisH family protein [Pyrinomonadaceae bacterium]|nr:XisH family protein [Pyrinomonadaceae bacterium]
MPAKDKFHDAVKNALTKDGWTITHDPFPMKLGKRDLFVDLGAKKLIAAEKGERKIAVEVKTFAGKSVITEAEKALGQYQIYKVAMEKKESDRVLFLAVSEDVFAEVFSDELGQVLLETFGLKVLTFDEKAEEIIEWKM